MADKHSLKYQLKIISIVLIAAFSLLLLYVLLSVEMTGLKQNIIENWTSWQKKLVQDAAYDAMNLNSDNFESDVAERVLPRLHFNEASYAVFYGNNTVIFEKNNETTHEKFGKSIREVYGAYSYYGGEHLAEVLQTMEDAQPGSDYFVKNYSKGNEYITWNVFFKNSKTYIIGCVTPENYILSLYKYEYVKNNFYAFAYIYSFLFVFYTILLCFRLNKYNKRVGGLEKELESADNKIANLKNKLKETDEKFESLSIYDFLTGLYNRKFFDILFPKIEADVFIPVTIAIIDINGLKLINSAFGYKIGDSVLTSVAEMCKEVCNKNDVLARYGNDEFAIVMINTSSDEAANKMMRISQNVGDKYSHGMEVDISFGIGTKISEEDNIYDIIIKAEQNLEMDKLTAINSTHSGAVSMLTRILQEKTSETKEHCDRISVYAAKLARAIGMNEKKVRELKMLAYLHDVGKISMPDAILNKEGSLNEEEYEIMKTHTEKGYNIAMASPDLRAIAKYILQHHERWDGQGYPRGIAGDKISIEARIISIADAFDAMVSRRVYKEGIDVLDALDELHRCAGSQFDPQLAEKFVAAMKQEISEKSGSYE